LPDQLFELKKIPPAPEVAFKLIVEADKWIEVDDFEGSGPSDKHFVLNKEKGEIKFGDGLMGLVPSQGSIIRVLEYMTGGGEEGNLMPERNWEIDDFKGSVINYLASTGGKEAQTIEEAIEDFCRDLKTPYTTVTLQDFEQLAMSTPGLRISRAKAIGNYDPNNPKPKNPKDSQGSVTVVIIPYSPLEFLEAPPKPSEEFKKAVCVHLDKRRLLGTNIHVISPTYVKVNVNATIVPRDSFRDDSLIREKVLGKLNRFLHPIKGGLDEKGWPIGRDIYLSEIYTLIENIEDVNCVLRLSISGDQNASTDADGNLILKSRIASVYSGVHNVEIFREKDQ
jgi:predicted phage baseplate assembly protein